MATADQKWERVFASSVISQATKVIPPSISVWVDSDDGLRITLSAAEPGDATFDFGLILEQPVGSLEENCLTSVLSFLGFLQDFLVLHLRREWPLSPRGAWPNGRIVAGRIYGWFSTDSGEDLPASPLVDVVLPSAPR